MGSHARTVSALQQAGVVVVNSTEELAQAAAALADGRLPPKQKNGIGLVTGQAGPGLLIVDGLKSADVDVPMLSPSSIEGIQALLPPMTFVKNPVDTGRPSPTFPQVVTAVAQDPGIDAVLVFGLSEPAVLNPLAALKPAKDATGKPVIFGSLGLARDLQEPFAELQRVGIPAVRSPERLVLVATALDADSRAQWRLANSEGNSVAEATPSEPRLTGPFNEDSAKANAFPPRRLDASSSRKWPGKVLNIPAQNIRKRPPRRRAACEGPFHWLRASEIPNYAAPSRDGRLACAASCSNSSPLLRWNGFR